MAAKSVNRFNPPTAKHVMLADLFLNTLVLGVSLTASTSPEEGHAGNQQISGPSGAT